jgi:hypothetical protein
MFDPWIDGDTVTEAHDLAVYIKGVTRRRCCRAGRLGLVEDAAICQLRIAVVSGERLCALTALRHRCADKGPVGRGRPVPAGERGTCDGCRECEKQRSDEVCLYNKISLNDWLRALEARISRACQTNCWVGYTRLIATSILPRVAFEYGHISSAACTIASAASRARPGMLTLMRTWRK